MFWHIMLEEQIMGGLQVARMVRMFPSSPSPLHYIFFIFF